MKKESKAVKRRLRSSYITSMISISLLLFIIGLIGLLIINAKQLSDHVKENIGFNIIINEDVREADIMRLQKNLDAADYVKSTRYITPEAAAREMKEILGEDFVSHLGYNPLLPSIELFLFADFANPDSIAIIEQELEKFPEIKEVHYQKSLVHLVNENVRKISVVLLIFSGLLLLISLTLINNTIRLSVYARRFIINTMQLVGATSGFIRKPFLYKSILHGIYAALIANALLIGVIYLAEREFGGVLRLQDVRTTGLLFLMVGTFGVIINLISTYIAVNRFLHLKTDELYY